MNGNETLLTRKCFRYYRKSRVLSPSVKRDVYEVYFMKQRSTRPNGHSLYTLEKIYNFEAKTYHVVIHDGAGGFMWSKHL